MLTMALLFYLFVFAASFADFGAASHRAANVKGQPGSREGTLSIGAFNIQIFGLDKMQDEVAVANIIEVCCCCWWWCI